MVLLVVYYICIFLQLKLFLSIVNKRNTSVQYKNVDEKLTTLYHIMLY